MASIWTIQFRSVCVGPFISRSRHRYGISKWGCLVHNREFSLKATGFDATVPVNLSSKQNEEDDVSDSIPPIGKIHQLVLRNPLLMNPNSGSKFGIWLCVGFAAVILVAAVRLYAGRKSRDKRPGSVADLVRRGQLRSDRRGISRPLKYEDPFNNPLVKVGKSNSTMEMCGKVYRMAPVTLTEEQQAIHQKRRSRAYQWKRPTMFLKEGDLAPPDVDPDTIRWIPANHPFATTATDIDEDIAQNNVYQKHGVPFRIQAEHEALQRKLEALQNEQKFSKLIIDPTSAKEFERPFKSHVKSDDHGEKSAINSQVSDSHSPNINSSSNNFESRSSTEENPSL